MNCRDARHYLALYLDSELESTKTFEVSRHLEACAACARLFEQEQVLERAIVERLARREGDEEEVFSRVLQKARLTRERRLTRRSLLAAAAVLVAALGFLWWSVATHAAALPEILAMAARDHMHFVRGEIEPICREQDPREVSRFLNAELQAEVSALPHGGDWNLLGARICHFEGERIGYVMLEHGGVPVSLFVVPERASGTIEIDPAEEKHCFETEAGRGMVRRTEDGVRVIVGRVAMASLEEALAPER
ncbi:MAG: zf-HC2 domain-containing protein [Planctomycetota bacterium]